MCACREQHSTKKTYILSSSTAKSTNYLTKLTPKSVWNDSIDGGIKLLLHVLRACAYMHCILVRDCVVFIEHHSDRCSLLNVVHLLFHSYYLQLYFFFAPYISASLVFVAIRGWRDIMFQFSFGNMSHNTQLRCHCRTALAIPSLSLFLFLLLFPSRWLWSTNKNLRQCHGSIKSLRYISFPLLLSLLLLHFMYFYMNVCMCLLLFFLVYSSALFAKTFTTPQ